jgi:hypothetical protein
MTGPRRGQYSPAVDKADGRCGARTTTVLTILLGRRGTVDALGDSRHTQDLGLPEALKTAEVDDRIRQAPKRPIRP